MTFCEPQKVLLIANSARLPYRVLRCAREVFESVHVFGSKVAQPLAISHFCRKFHAFTTPLTADEYQHVSAINNICVNEAIDFILPGDAEATRFIGEHQSAFLAKSFPVSPASVFDQLNNKDLFAELCERLMIPHPETRVMPTLEAVRQAVLDAGDDRGSFVIKPKSMWGSLGVFRIDASNVDEVLQRTSYRPILLQPFIAGEDATVVILSREGVLQRALCYRYHQGIVQFFENDKTVDAASHIATKLKYNGILVFDLRIAADGGIVFIECNPRFWYRVETAMLVGENFVQFGFDPHHSGEMRRPSLSNAMVRGPWALLRRILKPWTLSQLDLAAIRYHLRDPAFLVFSALQLFSAERRQASGEQL